jgi:hypothetical protein
MKNGETACVAVHSLLDKHTLSFHNRFMELADR